MVNSKNTQAPQTSNRGAILKVLARLATTGIISFGIGGAVTFDRYNNYWNQTIFRVQTVDFNILSHTLPTKLSYAIIKNKPEEVQRTLDSNYSLFGLIVTDSSGQKIISYSGKDSGKSSSWKAALNPQELTKHPYDVLLDPPPAFAQWTYSNSHATERSAISVTNQGRVIGRVYYVRGVRPTFQEDIATLVTNPFSGSSRIQTYATSLMACFGATLLIWSGLEFMLYKKRVDKKKAEKREDELENINKVLEVQLAERINELTLLKNQREEEKNELVRDASRMRILNTRLKQEIYQLKESLNNLPKNTENLLTLQTELEKTKLEAQENLNKQKQYQQRIEKLNHHLQLAQKKQLEANQLYKLKENELAKLQEQMKNIENYRLLAKSELQQLQSNEKNSQEIATRLEQELTNQRLEQQQLNNKLKSLQSSLLESQQRAKQAQAESERTRLEAQQNLNKQQQYQAHIEKLNRDLQIAQEKQLENHQPKEIELVQLKQQIYDAESELQKLRNNENNSQEIATTLEQQLINQSLEQEQLNHQLELLQSSLLESQQRARKAQIESEKARLEAQQNLNRQQEYEEQIKKLTQDLYIVQDKQARTNELKENELSQLQQQIQEIENSRSLVNSELQQLRDNETSSQRIITALEQQLANQNLMQEQLNTQLDIFQNSLLESQEREQQLEQREKQKQAELEALTIEIENIKNQTGRHTLNNFEIAIKSSLEQHFSLERVLTQFDVGSGQQGSKFTDFILVTNKCCIVVEAKSYKGTIKSVGNPRNTGWTCDIGTRKLYIYACWGENPYQQVKTYADSLYRYVNSSNWGKFPVYGVVVFPANSDIDHGIESNIGGFYRVTTLNNLINVIEQLDNQAYLQNARRYQRILQQLTGISNEQAA
ncbi:MULTISPECIES: NERD domain-containing protein [Nostoc]|uniref:NERD domain-containing protein n=2 Tax=Nostoc TaxID=1177 RepID=A0ABR8II18_9NOSO|nr:MULTISPECIES: NERD domain-containing protein [Nostoc]MBD2563950.1 NERD domain-containing protein [Nostoc linckia FACHB-391]MBD2650833.1 NERD domain-containing protein [Nostoc foliaceum FACHB-393]